jgi:NADH-quinone oxidoreductase subunit J
VADFAFWLIAALTLGSALMVVSSKSLLYSAYSLLFTFIGVTGLYVFLWADFLAVVQVVVYVGGILVLIIFGIMLDWPINLLVQLLLPTFVELA